MTASASDGHADAPAKRLARAAWRAGLGLSVHLARRAAPGDGPRVFYGGARAGDVGGPLVKVKRLAEHFPEHRVGFNTVYVLSNAPYLGAGALGRLKRRGVALVHNQNGVFYPAWYGGDWRAENARMAEPYRLADHVFWQSGFCRQAAERFLGGRSGPGEVLYNAVDTGRFRPAADGARGRFRFLITGKFFRHQAYALRNAIEGLGAAVRGGLDCELAFAGRIDPAARAAAVSAAEAEGLAGRLAFAGPYTQESAPAVYGAAQAYVTTRYKDNCPNSVLEAMACGLPVVHSASGGVPELVGAQAGAGVEVPDDWDRVHLPDPDALGEAMQRVAANRAAMAEAARARAVARFDLAAWIARHGEVFARLIGAAA